MAEQNGHAELVNEPPPSEVQEAIEPQASEATPPTGGVDEIEALASLRNIPADSLRRFQTPEQAKAALEWFDEMLLDMGNQPEPTYEQQQYQATQFTPQPEPRRTESTSIDLKLDGYDADEVTKNNFESVQRVLSDTQQQLAAQKQVIDSLQFDIYQGEQRRAIQEVHGTLSRINPERYGRPGAPQTPMQQFYSQQAATVATGLASGYQRARMRMPSTEQLLRDADSHLTRKNFTPQQPPRKTSTMGAPTPGATPTSPKHRGRPEQNPAFRATYQRIMGAPRS